MISQRTCLIRADVCGCVSRTSVPHQRLTPTPFRSNRLRTTPHASALRLYSPSTGKSDSRPKPWGQSGLPIHRVLHSQRPRFNGLPFQRTVSTQPTSAAPSTLTATENEPDHISTLTAEDTEPNLLLSAPTTRLLKLVRSLMDGYPHCVLLTRVGDFYESYYEHADDVGAMLDIQVVTRKIRSHHFRFTGFPARSIDRHLESLVMGHRRHVAICEQFQDPITRIFSRRLVRIVTPGTLIDEQFLNADQNNYLLAIYPMEPAAPSSDITTPGHGSPQGGEVPSDPPSLGLAWLDLATGDFLSSTTTISDLESDLTRIKPREI
ncbi:hypothetical protein H4R33_005065, partial [Dimargaris cristalligena]